MVPFVLVLKRVHSLAIFVEIAVEQLPNDTANLTRTSHLVTVTRPITRYVKRINTPLISLLATVSYRLDLPVVLPDCADCCFQGVSANAAHLLHSEILIKALAVGYPLKTQLLSNNTPCSTTVSHISPGTRPCQPSPYPVRQAIWREYFLPTRTQSHRWFYRLLHLPGAVVPPAPN